MTDDTHIQEYEYKAEMQQLLDGALGSPSLKRFVRVLTAADLRAAIAHVEAGL